MKVIALFIAVLIALAAAQQQFDRRDLQPQQQQQDQQQGQQQRGGKFLPFGNLRREVVGKYGDDLTKLEKEFAGYMTIVSDNNLDVHHVHVLLDPQQQQQGQQQQKEGRVLHMYHIITKDKKMHAFAHLQENERDLGRCFYCSSETSPRVDVGQWRQTQEKCGPQENGNVWLHQSQVTLQNRELDVNSAVCAADMKPISFANIVEAQGEPIFAISGTVRRELPEPSLNDSLTLRELQIPLACFTPSTVSDFKEFIQLMLRGDGGLQQGRRQQTGQQQDPGSEQGVPNQQFQERVQQRSPSQQVQERIQQRQPAQQAQERQRL